VPVVLRPVDRMSVRRLVMVVTAAVRQAARVELRPEATAVRPEGTAVRPEGTAAVLQVSRAAVASGRTARGVLRCGNRRIRSTTYLRGRIRGTTGTLPLTPEEEAASIGDDDVVLDDDPRSHTDLLRETLGAQIITEEPN
jgi:DNA polymerase-3 subunit gamma/tau